MQPGLKNKLALEFLRKAGSDCEDLNKKKSQKAVVSFLIRAPGALLDGIAQSAGCNVRSANSEIIYALTHKLSKFAHMIIIDRALSGLLIESNTRDSMSVEQQALHYLSMEPELDRKYAIRIPYQLYKDLKSLVFEINQARIPSAPLVSINRLIILAVYEYLIYSDRQTKLIAAQSHRHHQL